MENFLETRYFDFVNELDPFRDTDEDPETLEDMLYNCLYLFEDAIALTDAYGSDKASELKSILEAVYGK